MHNRCIEINAVKFLLLNTKRVSFILGIIRLLEITISMD